MATSFNVSFVGGETRTVSRRPVHELRGEAVCGDSTSPLRRLMADLWAADTGGLGTPADFEAWLETVDDWERAAEADASPPDQGRGTSPE